MCAAVPSKCLAVPAPARLAPQLCRSRRCRRACAQVLRAAAKDESTATLLREGLLPLRASVATLEPCRAS
jgi:hypothetical protein